MATVLAAIIAGIIAWRALRQRSIADRRSEWWSRAQWALDAAFSKDNERREMGMKVLQVLARSKLASKEELSIFDAALVDPLERYLSHLQVSRDGEDYGILDDESEGNDEHDNATGGKP